jgi:hypothetical protein
MMQQHQIPPSVIPQFQQQPQQPVAGQQQQQQHPTGHPHFLPHLPHQMPNIPVLSPHAGQIPQKHQTKKVKPSKKSLEDSILVTRVPDEESVTGHIKNREAIQKIRDAWIFKQIRQRQPEFTQYRTVRILSLVYHRTHL